MQFVTFDLMNEVSRYALISSTSVVVPGRNGLLLPVHKILLTQPFHQQVIDATNNIHLILIIICQLHHLFSLQIKAIKSEICTHVSSIHGSSERGSISYLCR